MTEIRSSIVDRLPSILPDNLIDIDAETHTFRYVDSNNTAAKTVYTLDAGPFVSIHDVRATVNGSRVSVPESAYETRQIQSDSGDDSIAFTDSDYYPDPGTEFTVDYRVVPIIERYVSSIDDEIQTVDTKIDDVIESHQIENASGDELDLLGPYFGRIGERSGRSDNDYEILLKSIVQSFAGRGTKPGMKFAIATAVGASPDDIVINENFEKVGYDIEIQQTELEFVTTAITDMAELADPSGVELLNAPAVTNSGFTVELDAVESTVVDERTGLGADEYDVGGEWTL